LTPFEANFSTTWISFPEITKRRIHFSPVSQTAGRSLLPWILEAKLSATSFKETEPKYLLPNVGLGPETPSRGSAYIIWAESVSRTWESFSGYHLSALSQDMVDKQAAVPGLSAAVLKW